MAHDLYRRDQYSEAAAEYRRALVLKPGYADLRNQLGVTLYALGDNAGAVEQFSHALEINPRYLEARVNRGIALRRLQRFDEARADFHAVLDQQADHQAAREQLEALDS
jgi:Tfp pilus assembly protein PilF